MGVLGDLGGVCVTRDTDINSGALACSPRGREDPLVSPAGEARARARLQGHSAEVSPPICSSASHLHFYGFKPLTLIKLPFKLATLQK